MNIHFPKRTLVQIVFTLLTIVLTVLHPFVGYIQIKSMSSNEIDIGNLENKIDIVFVSIIIIGISLSIIRYLIYRTQRFSIKRGILNLLNSILIIIFLGVTAQLGSFQITTGDALFSLNSTGLFLLLIAVWALLILKYIYDLFDFTINQSYYKRKIREKNRQ